MHFQSIVSVAQQIQRRNISPVEITEMLLERIRRHDSVLRSFLYVGARQARAAAKHAEYEISQGRYLGPLHGIPIAVKDNIYTKDMPTTVGMSFLRGVHPPFNATVVNRLQAAGAILLGKLHMTEAAMLRYDPEFPDPLNPWNEELWTGISSSGSGVATTAGLCYASLGTDTGGSLRYPAACNNLTAVQPTKGLVSNFGVFPSAPSYDVTGPMARSVEDVAIVLSAISGHDIADPGSRPNPPRNFFETLFDNRGAEQVAIGIDLRNIHNDGSTNHQTLMENVARTLERLGASIRETAFPLVQEPMTDQLLNLATEAAVVHQAIFPHHEDSYSSTLRAALQSGRSITAAQRLHVASARHKATADFQAAFKEVELILAPVFTHGTPTIDERKRHGRSNPDKAFKYSIVTNMAGLPSVTLPGGFDENGRPFGFQLIGPWGSEEKILRVAHAYQSVTSWHLAHPTPPSMTTE